MPNTPEPVSLEAEGMDTNSIVFSTPPQPGETKYNTTATGASKAVQTDGAVVEPSTPEATPPAPKPERALQLETAIAELEELKEELAAEASPATVEKVTDKRIVIRPINGGTQDITAGDTLEFSHTTG